MGMTNRSKCCRTSTVRLLVIDVLVTATRFDRSRARTTQSERQSRKEKALREALQNAYTLQSCQFLPAGMSIPLVATAGNVVAKMDLAARHLIDDTVSFMHPLAPASLVLGTQDVDMAPLFSVHAVPEDETGGTHWLEGTLQLGATEPVDVGFEMCADEVDDELAEHIALDTDDPEEDVGRTLVVRFMRTPDGGAVCDYVRIDVPLEDACAMMPSDDEAEALREASEQHQAMRAHLNDELIGAARAVASAARRLGGGAARGARAAGRAAGRGARRAGRAATRKASRVGAALKRRGGAARRGATRMRAKASARVKKTARSQKAKFQQARQRKTAGKGLKEISAKGKAQQKALQQQRKKPLPKTPTQKGKAPAKPTGKKATAKQQSAKKPASKKAAPKKAAPKKATPKKAVAKKPAAKQQGGEGGGLPGGGTPGGGAAEGPGGGAEGAGVGGGMAGGGAMGPIVLPAGGTNDVPPRTAFINVVPRPVPDTGPLGEPATVFDDPYAEEEEFFGEEEGEEGFGVDEGGLFAGEDLEDVGDELDDEDEYDDEEEEWIGYEMADNCEKWARIISPSDRWQQVRDHIEALARSESCYEPEVYLADIGAALLQ